MLNRGNCFSVAATELDVVNGELRIENGELNTGGRGSKGKARGREGDEARGRKTYGRFLLRKNEKKE